MENEEIIIVCTRIDIENKNKHIELQCTKCNHNITMSDSSIAAIKENYPNRDLIKYPPSPICLECFIKEKNKSTDKIIPLTNTQINEIIENI